MDVTVVNNVVGCARCGLRHPALGFVKLERPVKVADVSFSHWAPCPTNGEPILMRGMDAPA